MAAEQGAGGDGSIGKGLIGVGAVAEKPGMFGTALIFLLLPETLVIFGLVIAFILLGRL